MYNGRSLKHLETFEAYLIQCSDCDHIRDCIMYTTYAVQVFETFCHTSIHSVHIEGEHVHTARAGSENGSLFYAKPVVAASSKAKPLNYQWREAQIHACS